MEQLLEQKSEESFTKHDCERILRQALYIATALNQNHNVELIKNHYENYFGKVPKIIFCQ